ncbi:LytR C-terminal domain-containing protein [Streptomyces rubradiris]|uniref:LytR/CpsA/Psr regulator C-terminal domain-containing protein n=1 Tax=Streptomyces rubradiris TaxID=285531 RepID=A0ABQ3RBH5_STRRR|nr:LytR C-terminal domain-containing protein [Streptomyces rubradiris]GHH27913.1 hypothetical protein GCM10018792_70900 [Streptomyces rubradiris]GHI53203.1 hypothetical protein Srubr_30490 [Streptomyces rubradiris]
MPVHSPLPSRTGRRGAPLTTGSGARPRATEPAARIAVTVRNGTGITGRARPLADALTGRDFRSATTGNAPGPCKTVTLDGVAMTPARACATASAGPDSGG